MSLVDRPTSISLPSPPPLSPSRTPSSATPPSPPPTNTYALLLPLPALFAPRLLALLRAFYERFGPVRHWAPVRGLGRVIVVWEREADARRAKEGGGDRVEVALGGQGTQPRAEDGSEKGQSYFVSAQKQGEEGRPRRYVSDARPAV